MTDDREVPASRLRRIAALAGVGVRTGASLLVPRDGDAAARHAAEVLGSLRGLAAKAGQMASYVDGFVPAEHRLVYESALAGLRASAPASPSMLVRKLVHEELGAPVEALFAQWDERPFASASIGQVHRARLADGREVAVKVQHPGVGRAMAADLENARVLQTLIGAAGPRALNARAMYEEVAARFTEELDYALEASRQRAFRALHAGDPHIRIPEVIAERSSRRVLTTELARGTSLDAVAAGDEARRRHYAEVLWRFVFKGVLVGGAFNADPHPDNYLFAPDGEVVFIDFGCVQSLEGDPLASTRDAHRAALQRDEAAFAEAVRKLYRTAPGSYERALIEHTRRSFEPLFASPYRLTAEYVAELVRGLQGLKRLMLSRGAGFTPIPPCLLLMNRLQFGFYSVLRRLDVRVDYAAVEGRVLAEADLLR